MAWPLKCTLVLIIFHCWYFGNAQTSLLRGPYLQLGTQASIIIRWKTSTPTSTRVTYGPAPNTYTLVTQSEELATDHEVQIKGLKPNTRYYYTIGSITEVIQGDEQNYFKTYPPSGTDQKLRFWITGDCGNSSDNQRDVRNQYLNYVGTAHTDGWLLLGDNAYVSGLENEYDANFFAQYEATVLKNSILWPAPGNHDYANDGSLQKSKSIPYYNLFTLPTNGEAGGVASHTESYYSFNVGNVHFISLDSYGIEGESSRLYDTLSPQVEWLKEDLAQNNKMWTVAYWHHPPYTKGSHNSDTEDELILIRNNLNKVLERFKIDMVLCGHSHAYERSKLIKGHYGLSTTFNAAYVLNPSTAKYDGSPGSCPIVKNSTGKADGVIYIVSGSAGQVGGSSSVEGHPAMHYTNTTIGGSLIMEVEGNRLDMKWLAADGNIDDALTMMKDVGVAKKIVVGEGMSVTLKASWHGEYDWSRHHETTQSINVSPFKDTLYLVTDKYACLTDSFKIHIDPVVDVQSPDVEASLLEAFPNPATNIVSIRLPYAGPFHVNILDFTGRAVAVCVSERNSLSGNATINLEEQGLGPGLYFLEIFDNRNRWIKRVVIE